MTELTLETVNEWARVFAQRDTRELHVRYAALLAFARERLTTEAAATAGEGHRGPSVLAAASGL